MPLSEPSLCIPFVHASVNRERIMGILNHLDLGTIERIDIVAGKTSRTGKENNKIFIHFISWSNNPNAVQTRNRVLNGGQVKVVYDDPWYWMISASRVVRPENRPPSMTLPFLDFTYNASTQHGVGEGYYPNAPGQWAQVNQGLPPPMGPPPGPPPMGPPGVVSFGVGTCPRPSGWGLHENMTWTAGSGIGANGQGYNDTVALDHDSISPPGTPPHGYNSFVQAENGPNTDPTPPLYGQSFQPLHPLSAAIPNADIPNTGDEPVLQLAAELDANNEDGGDTSTTDYDLINMDAVEDFTNNM